MTRKERDALRSAVAAYMYTEGCSCCQDQDGHLAARTLLAKLLGVPKRDGWHDFSKYRADKSAAAEQSPTKEKP